MKPHRLSVINPKYTQVFGQTNTGCRVRLLSEAAWALNSHWGRTAESVGRGEKTGRSVWSNMHSKYIKVQPLRDRYKPLPKESLIKLL